MNAPDDVWRKSSYSTSVSNCVEVAWRKSSFSGGGPNCVEVAWPPRSATAVRDSKNVSGPALTFPFASWQAFVRA
jgi:hypothetical protein